MIKAIPEENMHHNSTEDDEFVVVGEQKVVDQRGISAARRSRVRDTNQRQKPGSILRRTDDGYRHQSKVRKDQGMVEFPGLILLKRWGAW